MIMATLKFVVAHKAPFWCFGIWYKCISAGTREPGVHDEDTGGHRCPYTTEMWAYVPLHTSMIRNFRDAGKRWNGGDISQTFCPHHFLGWLRHCPTPVVHWSHTYGTNEPKKFFSNQCNCILLIHPTDFL